MKVAASRSRVPLSQPEKELLCRTEFHAQSPGPLLADFETLINFVGPQGIPVGKRGHLLATDSFYQLNARLCRSVSVSLNRPKQKSFPHINGLYLLLRAAGLVYVAGSTSKPLLVLDETVLQSWQRLNATERYFNLLEAWQIWGSPDMISERLTMGGISSQCLMFWNRLPAGRERRVVDEDEMSRFSYIPGWYNLALMELFGWISIVDAAPQAGKGWRIASIKRQPFGSLLLTLFGESFLLQSLGLELETSSRTFGKLQPLFQPLFPAWRNNLAAPETRCLEGLYVFRVSLGSVWRRIAIPGSCSFDTLSGSILDAFDFDYDHLYTFTYKNRFGVKEELCHPYMEDGVPAAATRIDSLSLKTGSILDYVYDFGDNWQFKIKLEEIRPADRRQKGPVCVEIHGKAPRQYTWGDSWDDEGEES